MSYAIQNSNALRSVYSAHRWRCVSVVGLTGYIKSLTAFALATISSGYVLGGDYDDAENWSKRGQRAELIGSVRLPGTSIDKTELKGTLETNSPVNALGGMSAIDYTGEANRYVVLSDRGPADGASSFPCRFHRIDLKLDVANKALSLSLVDSTLLMDETSTQLTGSLEQLKSWAKPGRCPSIDPEGIRVAKGNQLVISEEYGPTIDVYEQNGRRIKSLLLPEKYLLAEFRNPPMVTGTFPNRGLEGLAITPNGSTIVAAMQGPLVQDGRIEGTKCLGLNTRWLVYNDASKKPAEYVYPLDDESTGISEVLAISDELFLVIERDSLSGSLAKNKSIHLASIRGATDVSAVESLKAAPSGGFKSIRKLPFINLMNPAFGMNGENTPEKPEGITWGPDLPDGRRSLVVCFDNDFDLARDSIVAVFAIPQ